MYKIYIAEDNQTNRYFLKKVLTNAGYEVKIFKNGKELLDALNSGQPDLIVTDIKMPVMDGFEMIEQIRELDNHDHLPIIIISATYKDIKNKIKGYDLGANDYLTSPIDEEELVAKVNFMIRVKNLYKEIQESEERYRTVFENTGAATVTLEENMTISLANGEFISLSGYSKKEIENKMKWTDFVLPEDLERMKKYHLSRREAGEKAPTEYEFRMIDKKGTIKNMFTKIGMISNTKKSIASLTDITKIKETENNLIHRVELEKLITSISTRFVGIPLDRIDDDINQMLKTVGQFTHIDRSYFFLFSEDGSLMDNTHEWCAPGIEAEIDNLQGIPSSTLPWWMEKLNRNETIHIPRVDELPSHAQAEKKILQSQNIQSVLVVPVIKGSKLIGFIGFDAVKQVKSWTKEDITLLRTLGDIVAQTLEGKKAEKRIKHLNLVLCAIRNVNQLIVKEKDREKLIQKACKSLIETRGYHNAWIVLLDEEEKLKSYAESGLGKDFLPMIELLKRGKLTVCSQKALKQEDVTIIEDPLSTCTDCPLAQEYSGRGTMTIRLGREGKIYGVMSVSVPADFITDKEEQALFTEIAKDISLGLHSIEMRKKMNEQTRDLKQNYKRTKRAMDTTIQTMSKIVEAKDPYTSGHQKRVSQLATAIAKELNLPKDKTEGIRIASIIHDIGKVSIPTEILSKPTTLSDIEFSLIKSHSQIGYNILKSIDFTYPVAQIVLHHHERINGSGYPNQLKEDEILLEAKIIGVADVVEAMSSHRPYRPALGIDVALDEIIQNKGILYDPEVVAACVKLFREKGFKLESQRRVKGVEE